MSNVSDGIYILTWQDLNARENTAFARGVEHGRLQAILHGKAEIARNCKNWTSKGGATGYCEICGAQTQNMEVSDIYRCPSFERREAISTAKT